MASRKGSSFKSKTTVHKVRAFSTHKVKNVLSIREGRRRRTHTQSIRSRIHKAPRVHHI
jgi:hypothetical protein